MHPDLDTLYRENAARVAVLAFQLTGDRVLADDVVQETFLAAHRGLKAFRGEAAPSTWLYRIAVRIATRLREQSRRQRGAGLHDQHGTTVAGIVPDAGDAGDEMEELLLALDALPEEHRVVMSLMNLRDLPVTQVAEVLGIPEGTVWSRASAARKRMRAWLEARRAPAA